MSTLGSTEERDDLTRSESRDVRRRSTRLLGSLLHPLRLRLALTALVVVVSTAAQVAGPTLIALGIDNGLPAVLDGDATPIVLTVAAYLLTGLIGAVLIAWYTVLSARISQAIAIDRTRWKPNSGVKLTKTPAAKPRPIRWGSSGRRRTRWTTYWADRDQPPRGHSISDANCA